ncbi:hypothetical protein BgiBS90_005986, partial [Biomphalaria glabrata]
MERAGERVEDARTKRKKKSTFRSIVTCLYLLLISTARVFSSTCAGAECLRAAVRERKEGEDMQRAPRECWVKRHVNAHSRSHNQRAITVITKGFLHSHLTVSSPIPILLIPLEDKQERKKKWPTYNGASFAW